MHTCYNVTLIESMCRTRIKKIRTFIGASSQAWLMRQLLRLLCCNFVNELSYIELSIQYHTHNSHKVKILDAIASVKYLILALRVGHCVTGGT